MSDQATLSSPELVRLEPNTALTTDGQFIIAVWGEGFTMDSQVLYDGQGMATGMLAADLLSAPMNPGLWHGEPVTIRVTVRTGEHETAALEFKLKEPESKDGEREGRESGSEDSGGGEGGGAGGSAADGADEPEL